MIAPESLTKSTQNHFLPSLNLCAIIHLHRKHIAHLSATPLLLCHLNPNIHAFITSRLYYPKLSTHPE